MIQKIKTKFSGQDFFKVVKDFGNYFTADMATKAIAFISIPVYTRLIDVSEYGIYSVFFSYASIITVIFSLNTYSSIGRYYFENKKDFNSFFGTSIILVAIIFLINSVFLILFKNEIAYILKLPVNLMLLFIPISICQIGISFFRNINVPLRNSLKIAKLNLFFAIFTFITSVIILYLLKDAKYKGPIYANVIIGIIVVIIIIFDLKKYMLFSFPKKEHIKYILNYSVPLIPYILGGTILVHFDRMMINSISGSKDAGLYSLAYNIGMIINAIEGALFSAWMPDYYKYMNNKNYLARDKDINRIIKIIIISAIGLTFFCKEIGYIFANKNYHEGLSLIPIIVLGYVIFSIFRIYGDYPFYKKKTYWLSIIFLFSGVINIILNKIYILKYGYIAGAYTTTISYFTLLIFAILIAKYVLKIKITPLKYIYYPILIYLLSFICYYIFLDSYYVLEKTFFIRILIKTLFFITFGFLLFLQNIKKIYK